jgi:hypothetical protein
VIATILAHKFIAAEARPGVLITNGNDQSTCVASSCTDVPPGEQGVGPPQCHVEERVRAGGPLASARRAPANFGYGA